MLTSKQKFYIHNADIFGKYFENGDYLALCRTNLAKVEKTISEKSDFNFEAWASNLLAFPCVQLPLAKPRTKKRLFALIINLKTKQI